MTRIALLLIALSLPAAAQRVSEPGTGLSVVAPTGHVAALTAPRAPNVAAIAVHRPDETETGCLIAYRPAPQNAPFSQAEINTAVSGPNWREDAMRTIGLLYTIEHSGALRHAGIDGVLLEGVLKMRAGLPASVENLRTLFVILETPLGRTSAICVAERSEFNARRPGFIAAIRSVRLPTGSALPTRTRAVRT